MWPVDNSTAIRRATGCLALLLALLAAHRATVHNRGRPMINGRIRRYPSEKPRPVQWPALAESPAARCCLPETLGPVPHGRGVGRSPEHREERCEESYCCGAEHGDCEGAAETFRVGALVQVESVGPAFRNVSGDGGRIVVAKIIAGCEGAGIGAFLHAPYRDPLLIEVLDDGDVRWGARTVDGGDDERCDQEGDADDCADPGQRFANDADDVENALSGGAERQVVMPSSR